MPDRSTSDAFLDGGDRATRMIREKDWRAHPLGEPHTWSTELRTALSLVLNSPESMILAWGPELHFFFNQTYFPLLGPRLEWAMGAPFKEVWSEAWEQAKPIIDDAFAGRSQRFVDLPWKLGTDRGAADTWWTFSYSRVLDAQGAVAGLFILTTETTERVQTDRALAESQAQLHALNENLERSVVERTAERDRLWETTPDLLVMMDDEGFYERANPAWMTLLGYAPEEVVGRSHFALVHADDQAATRVAYGTARLDAGLPIFENRLLHKDGSVRHFSWVAAASGDKVFAVGRHVTDYRRAQEALRQSEERLRQSQKVEAIGQLTGGVAHDFNNLLTVIRGSVELLQRPNLSEERRRRYVDAIGATAERATRLTAQLLAFARRQTLKPAVIDACEAVRVLEDMLHTLCGSRIRIDMEIPQAPLYVDVDPNQCDTAIVNIVANARDAMKGEGDLHIRVSEVAAISASPTHEPLDGPFVAITITDSGSGIDPAALALIFEPFFTTKAVGEGTGLGLSQVFGFARQSGGEIIADSRPGEGATFTLYLPRVPAPFATAAESPPMTRVDGRHRVLVVEDDAGVGAFAIDALEELGHDALLTENATEALRALEAEPDRYDLVFSDVMMPGMSGIDLAREIGRRHPHLPVVLASGYSSVLAQDGITGFPLLKKPYSIEELARMLEQTIAGAAARRR